MFLYKMLLTLNATSWMAIIYAIKEGWTIGKIPSHLFGILLLIIPVFLSWLSLALSRFLGAESPVVNCKEFNLADGEFLPIYLGYFFVSVGVSEHFTMAMPSFVKRISSRTYRAGKRVASWARRQRRTRRYLRK